MPGVVTASFRPSRVVLLGLLFVGCRGVLGIEEWAPRPTGEDAACTLNSDCEGALVCLFERCSVECVSDEDCDATEQCLRTGEGSQGCVSPERAVCTDDAACPDGTRCDGGECRATCGVDRTCVTGQQCRDGVCVGATPDAGSSSGGTGGATGGAGMGAAPSGGSGGGGNGGTGAAGGAGGGAATGASGGTLPDGGLAGDGGPDCTAPPGVGELCNGLDDDCDGSTDEDAVGAPSCALTTGVCAGATPRCGGTAGWLACDATDYGSDFETVESVCDRMDNDCDGTVDEGCCSQVCDLAPSCGCALDEACYPTATADVNGCMPPGSGVEEDSCTEHGDCQPGLVCLGLTGRCRRTCVDDSACDPDQGSRCIVTVSGVTANVCTSACDPITGQGCQGGDGCYTYNDAGGDVTNCAPSGVGTSGGSCATSGNSDCATGFWCVDVGGSLECRETCVVGGPATCGAGSCQSLTSPVVIGTTTYGVCL